MGKVDCVVLHTFTRPSSLLSGQTTLSSGDSSRAGPSLAGDPVGVSVMMTLIQAADLVAYSIYRRYERSDTFLLDKIVGRFQREDKKIHGLMHLIAGYRNCTCPACLSRQ